MTIFNLRLAGVRAPKIEGLLVAYAVICPILYVASAGSELVVGRIWTSGLTSISLCAIALLAIAAWRQRTVELIAVSVASILTFLAGTHDLLVHMTSPLLAVLSPGSLDQRLLVLNYAANVQMVVMGCLLAARFIRALNELARLNNELENRVAQRERTLVEKYHTISELDKRHATDEERQRIMRDLHDGLGSQLFVTLTRAEAGTMAQPEIVQALRECISDMRLTLMAMDSRDGDFLIAWSNFRYRWERQLQSAGVASEWTTAAASEAVLLSPQTSLQLLRISQEALTNVLKHARATRVRIGLTADERQVRIEVQDDGVGLAADAGAAGRGMANMQNRAERIGATFTAQSTSAGTGVQVMVNSAAMAN
jgi:signal transduction histidine kinase